MSDNMTDALSRAADQTIAKIRRERATKERLRRSRMLSRVIYLFCLGGLLLQVYRGADLRQLVMFLLFIELMRAFFTLVSAWAGRS